MLWVTIAVAVINAIYVGVALLQWRAIKRQADIAKGQSDHLTNLERPWILVTKVDRKEFPERIENGQARISGAYFVVQNFGRSPAWIMSMGGNFVTIKSVADLPPEPQYKTVIDARDQGLVLVPVSVDGTDSQHFTFPHESGTSINSEFGAAIKQTILWCIYGCVVYRDFSGEKREMGFCHALTHDNDFRPLDAGPAYTYRR